MDNLNNGIDIKSKKCWGYKERSDFDFIWYNVWNIFFFRSNDARNLKVSDVGWRNRKKKEREGKKYVAWIGKEWQ